MVNDQRKRPTKATSTLTSGVDASETSTRDDMHIRPAQPTDAETVNELLRQLGYPQDSTATTASRIRTWDDDTSSAAYVADADGELLGVIAVHSCPFFERAGSWARIVALVVSSQARGQGVGSQLMEAAEVFAISRGCTSMEVTSANHRQDTHEFYRRRGYQTGASSRFLHRLNDAKRHEDQPRP